VHAFEFARGQAVVLDLDGKSVFGGILQSG
jgi:hypothetical protein